MKRILLVLAVVFSAITLIHAEDNSEKIRLACGNMLYYKYDMWQGTMVTSERNPKGYSIYSEDFKKLIKRIPASYKEYQESQSKQMLGYIIEAGSSLVGLGVMYLGVQSSFSSMSSGSGNSTISIPLVVGGALIATAGDLIGYMFLVDSVNYFELAIHEYNKAMIYVGMRENGTVGIQKNIDF